MSIELELLSALYSMYKEGDLNNEFDKTKNRMIASSQLVALMKDVASVLPEELKPLEAAKRMRELPIEEVDKAIAESDGKVVDMRKAFQRKMSLNGGALGLTKQLVDAQNSGDIEKAQEVMQLMHDLAAQEP